MFLFSYTKKKPKKNTQSGFSLIELMVTIIIVTLVTGMVMVKYGSFNGVVILKSQAYELALDIRTAQTYGVNAKGAVSSFRGAYGIYFDITSGSGDANQYTLFQDQNGDREYDTGEEIGDVYTIDTRFAISKICTISGGASDCTADKASIAFQRPDFDAHLWTDAAGSGETQIDITVSVVSNTALERVVTVYSSGQISVQ